MAVDSRWIMTPESLALYYDSLDIEAQHNFMERLISIQQQASSCFIMDHTATIARMESELAELRSQNRDLTKMLSTELGVNLDDRGR